MDPDERCTDQSVDDEACGINALRPHRRLMRAVRIVFLVGFVSVITAFVALSVVYGFDVQYRFEVAAITIDWTVLIVAGALLAIAYRTRSEAASA